MIIRTSKAGENSFKLQSDRMTERDSRPYYIFRSDLRAALFDIKSEKRELINVGVGTGPVYLKFTVQEGKTQRGKKFIQIGCKRFIGVNRTRLIRWALSAK